MSNRIDRIRKRLGLAEADPIGAFGSFGEGTEITEAPDGGMTLKLVITTDAVDLDGDIVLPEGADWSYWERAGLPVYLEHEYGVNNTVGVGRKGSLKLVKIGQMAGWTMSVGIRKTEEGQAVAAFVRDVGRIGSSIGFRTVESRNPTADEAKRTAPTGIRPSRVIPKWLGLEMSLTVMPCNPTAGGQAEKMIGELDRLVTKGAITLKAARALGLPEEKRTTKKPRRIIVCKG